MPEGHTIHRAARDQRRLLAGRALAVSSPQGRFSAAAAALDGRVLEDVEAYGKHLFWWWDDGRVVHVHLGLFGRFRTWTGDAAAPRETVRVRLVGDDGGLDLIGPTDCSLLDRDARGAIVARLGPDPLRRDADPARFHERVARSRRSIADLLLDQSVIAGVGNVYRAEALFACGIAPSRPGSALGADERERLWETCASMLARGVREGRIATVEAAEVGARSRSRIPRRDATRVYGQTACRTCGASLVEAAHGGRPCRSCPACQPA